jgi:anti-sigma-K factor RskA
MKREKLLELIPAYALDALDKDERIMVKDLLETDVEAQQLLEEYTSITNILAFATPIQAAPRHLNEDLRQRLKKRDNISEKKSEKIAAPKKNLSIQYRLFISSAAALIVMFIGIFFYVNQNGNNESTGVPKGLILYNEIAEQSNPQRFEVSPTGAEHAIGELLVSEDGSQAVLRIAELPTIAENERYQLWLAQEEIVESGGLFYWPTGHGPYYIIMPLERHISEYVRFGMSVEPENGSPNPNAPSGTPLFSIAVARAR